MRIARRMRRAKTMRERFAQRRHGTWRLSSISPGAGVRRIRGGSPCAEHSCVVVRRRVARASGVRVFGRDGTICFDVKEGGADSCF